MTKENIEDVNNNENTANNASDKIRKTVETVDYSDIRNYIVLVELTVVDDKGNESSQIMNIFSKDTAEAFSWMLKLGDIYNRPGVTNVKLVGAYERVALKVVTER